MEAYCNKLKQEGKSKEQEETVRGTRRWVWVLGVRGWWVSEKWERYRASDHPRIHLPQKAVPTPDFLKQLVTYSLTP